MAFIFSWWNLFKLFSVENNAEYIEEATTSSNNADFRQDSTEQDGAKQDSAKDDDVEQNTTEKAENRHVNGSAPSEDTGEASEEESTEHVKHFNLASPFGLSARWNSNTPRWRFKSISPHASSSQQGLMQ